MALVVMDSEELESLMKRVITEANEHQQTTEQSAALTILLNGVSPVLNKQKFMEFLDIGPTKASELLNREGFPVTRHMGSPIVLTHLLIQWIEENSGWVKKNAGEGYKSRKHRAV